MSAGKLRKCDNVQEFAWKIEGYVNNSNLCAENSTCTLPKSKHSYYLIPGIPKDDDWRVFTKLMYDKINTMANSQEETVPKLRAHEAQTPSEEELHVPAIFSKLQMKSDTQKQSRKSYTTGNSDSERHGRNSESENQHPRQTQECYRCHKVGYIVW